MFIKKCTLCDRVFEVEKIEDFLQFFYKNTKGKYKTYSFCRKCRAKDYLRIKDKILKQMREKRGNRTISKKCIICSDNFTTIYSHALVCSLDCRKEKNRTKQFRFLRSKK